MSVTFLKPTDLESIFSTLVLQSQVARNAYRFYIALSGTAFQRYIKAVRIPGYLCFSKQLVKLALQVLTQYSNFDNVIRNIQNKLVNLALKSDLKSTATFRNFLQLRNSLNPNVQNKSHL